MLKTRPVGRQAASRKYDVITAMGAYALSLGKADQRRVLRLITLITARYNWQRDELAVGQREIAKLWTCDERTVKREMARLRGLGWLVVRRQGARGRVSEYRIDLDRILEDTRGLWPSIGPDFVARLDQTDEVANVVPFQGKADVAAPDVSTGTEWALASAVLHAEDGAGFGAWLAALKRAERAGGRLTLTAPSRFHAAYVQTHFTARILAACRAVDDEVSEIRVVFDV